MKFIFLPGWAGGTEDFEAVIHSLPKNVSTKILYEAPIINSFSDASDFESFTQSLAKTIIHDQEPFFLCGYSMGGRLAISLASKLANQKSFSGLIVLSASLGMLSGDEKKLREIKDQEWAQLLETNPAKFWDLWYTQEVFSSLESLDWGGRQKWLVKRIGRDPKQLAQDMLRFGQSRHDYLLSNLESLAPKPVLYISGALDQKYSQIGEFLKSSIQNITVLNIPKVGHILPLEAPAETAKAMVNWAQSQK